MVENTTGRSGVVETELCSQCGFMFPKPNQNTLYFRDWCNNCIEEIEIPAQNRFPEATAEDLAEVKERHERTRQSLKQRALDRKNGIGRTTIQKTETDADRTIAPPSTEDADFLIYHQDGE